MSVNGLVVMTPTSIASTGTGNSSSIGANGKVTFSSCETISLNGVFTSTYDNYMIVLRGKSANSTDINARLRASGTDASGTNYTRQYISADSTTVSAARTTSQTALEIGYAYGDVSGGLRQGITCYLFGPYLAQPTATRSVTASDYLSGYVRDTACTHSLSTSYDGITIFNVTAARVLTGEVTVYGFNQ